jgi:membrane protease YdiL (CAAX protease family)
MASTPLPPVPVVLPDKSLAARLRAGPLEIFAILLILVTSQFSVAAAALLAVVWVYLSRTPWHEIGYVREKKWSASIAIGVIFGVAFKLVMKAIVMPLLGAPAVIPTFQEFVHNRAAIPLALLFILAGAGWGEETLFRGWAFERLGKVFGTTRAAKSAIIAITSVWFGFAHYRVLGIHGTEQAMIVGFIFAVIFARTGRLFPLMIAHAAYDLTAYAIVYWALEGKIAHLIFR